jgi:hypothetical protein
VEVEIGDVRKFLLALSMVKVHHIIRVALAAIRTWLFLGASKDLPDLSMVVGRPSHIGCLVLAIILLEIFGHTRAAIALSPLPFRGKFAQWLDDLTPTTALCKVLIHRTLAF